MQKKYNRLWVLGDSYTTPEVCVQPCDSFWGLAAKHLHIPSVMNCSRSCNSFDSVCHLLVGMQDNYDWQHDLFFIGVPPLERITVFDDYQDTAYIGHDIDTDSWAMQPFDIASHRGLISLQNFGADRQLIIHTDRAWVETQALRTIFFLTKWLDSMDAKYMIINLSKDFDKNNRWGPSEFVLPYAQDHARCILFDNCYYSCNLYRNQPVDFDKFGWFGHHGSVGNRYFFENSLLPAMTACDLI